MTDSHSQCEVGKKRSESGLGKLVFVLYVIAASLVGSIFITSCSDAKKWPALRTQGIFSAELSTRWRDDLLYYQLAVAVDSALYKDSIPTKALLRMYDDNGFEVLSVTVPVGSTGAKATVYANANLLCPRERRAAVSCYRGAVESASRWTLLPYAEVLDPFRGSR